MTTIYCAKWILLPSGEILQNGALSILNDRIAYVGPRGKLMRSAGDRLINLGDIMLLPGLINMHIHLEEGVVRSYPMQEDETFASWIAKKQSRIKLASQNTIAASIRLGARELLSNGITTVLDSSRTGLSSEILSSEPIRSCIVHEVNPDDLLQENAVIGLLEERISLMKGAYRTGVGPYAVFSLSPDHHREVLDFAAQRGFLWASHIAESAEELQAFSEKTGDLFFHITRKKGWNYGKPSSGSIDFALANGLIPKKAVCFHCNYVNGAELDKLHALDAWIVQCLQYTSALGHKPFPIDAARLRKIPLCLGTESIVYSESMNLFDELNVAKQYYPHIPAKEMLSWVTINPARALGAEHELGSLLPGKLADVIGVSIRHEGGEDVLEQLILGESGVRLVIIGGEEVIANY